MPAAVTPHDSFAPRNLHSRAREFVARGRWLEAAALAGSLPDLLTHEWLPAADDISFALGHLHRHREAARLLEAAWAIDPIARRAANLAYIHYDALMLVRAGELSAELREPHRKEFLRWIGQALRMQPGSVKDLYRLGVFEAQVEACRDKAALRAFLAAIDAHAALPMELRDRGDLRKALVRSLYAGGRSALRLGQLDLARRLSFDAIRRDAESDFLEGVHKMALAGKVCLARGDLAPAERALRLALDAKGPPRRDWLFGLLAQVATARKDHAAAATWIEAHVPAHRRSAALWRQLGDIRRVRNDPEGAAAAWDSSLLKDRAGRHLTLARIGDLRREQGALDKAYEAYRRANEFRRRKWLSEDPSALEGMAAVHEARGQVREAHEKRSRAAGLRGRHSAGSGHDPSGGDEEEGSAA